MPIKSTIYVHICLTCQLPTNKPQGILEPMDKRHLGLCSQHRQVRQFLDRIPIEPHR